MPASLYAQYITERGDAKVIEIPEGFVSYNVINENQIYVMDVFVKLDYRRTHIASELTRMVENEGRRQGCKEIITTVIPTLVGSTISIKAILNYGFTLQSASNNMIVFKKDII